MKCFLFYDWCRKATRLIRYKHDRQAVYDELMAHLEDKQAEFETSGMPVDSAQRKALEAMGSPDAIAAELADIHKPFWGYTFSILRVICILLCVAVLFTVGQQVISTCTYLINYDSSCVTMPPDEYWTKLAQGSAAETHHSDGYWFRIPNASLWQKDGKYCLCFEFQQFDGWLTPMYSSIYNEFWAVDDLGNIYTAFTLSASTHPGFLEVHRLQIADLPSGDIQWVELHYDRDGRNIVLHIDLTGGDSQ